MSELRAGGLALILNSCTKDEIGKCVVTERLCMPGSVIVAPTGHSVRVPNEKCWLVTGDVCAGVTCGGYALDIKGWALYPPDLLMPIDGEKLSHKDEQMKELTNG